MDFGFAESSLSVATKQVPTQPRTSSQATKGILHRARTSPTPMKMCGRLGSHAWRIPMKHDRPLVGALSISVDLADKRRIESCHRSGQLFRLFQDKRLPVTWAFAEPGSNALAASLHASDGRHEIALLCQPEWAADSAGRTAFAQQLKRRVLSAEQAGVKISTVAMQSADLTTHLDLLAKSRVSVIRGRLDRRRHGPPESVRFGVWYAPVSVDLTSGHSWPWFKSSRHWKRTIRRALRPSGYVHLGLDVDALTRDSLLAIEAAVQATVRMRDEGRLQIGTLSELAERLSHKRNQPAARSVLYAA